MRVVYNFDFTTIAPDRKSLKNFVSMLRKLYEKVAQAINGNISFGDGTNSDNVSGSWVNVTTPVAPNTDFTVTHNLGRLPVGYWVMYKDRAVDVYTGSVAATVTQLTLRATVASAVIRLFIICLVLSLFGLSAKAQTTTVTLQVTDSGGQSWNNGTWSVVLATPPGIQPAGPPFNRASDGVTVPGQTQTGVLNGTGSASITLTQNSGIVPSQSQWRFTVCSQATATNNCFIQFATITSSTTVTLTPPVLIVNAGPNAVAYADSEVVANIGQQYYNTTIPGQRQCTAGTGNGVCTSWAAVGGGGSFLSTPALVINGGSLNVAPGTNGQINATGLPTSGTLFSASFGVKADERLTTTASTAITSPLVNDVNLAATAADIGKVVYVTNCPVYPATAIVPIQGTIVAVNSATQIQASANASANQTNGCLHVGTDDTAAEVAADTAAFPNGFGVADPKGRITLTGPIHQCGILLQVCLWHGAGRNNTTYSLAPQFNFAGVNSAAVGGTLGGPFDSLITYYDFQIDGNLIPFATTKQMLEGNTGIATMVPGGLHDVDFINWGVTGIPGLLDNSFDTKFQDFSFTNANICAQFGGGQQFYFNVIGHNCTFTVGSDGGIFKAGAFHNTVAQNIFNVSGLGTSFIGVRSYGAPSPNTTLNIGAAPIHLIYYVQTPTENGPSIINAGTIYLAHSNPTAITNNSVIIDACANTFSGAITGTGSFTGDCSVTGTDVAGNHVLTSGWGTANVNTVTGSTLKVKFTISITGGVPAISPVLTDTFAAPFFMAAPAGGCTLIQVAGTFGILSNPSFSALTKTGIVWTFTGTPVNGQSYTFVRSCNN